MPRLKKQHLKQRKDGRYCAVYHGIQFMASTEDEALSLREEYKRREKDGAFSAAKMRFLEYASKWMADYKSHLSMQTYNVHVSILNRFAETSGNKLLADYTPSDISRYYQTLAGKSQSTIANHRNTIRGVFRAAYADDLIRKDPTMNIQTPKGYKGTHRAITPVERALIHQTQHRLRPAVMVMLYAGLRKGEVMALDIDRDVNFAARTISVRQAVRMEGNRPAIVTPKTEAGVRTIPLLDILARELYGKHGLICTSASGEMMTHDAWINAWRSYLYALGVTRNGCHRRYATGPWEEITIRAHDLRHSYCTMLYDAGVDLKSAMLWMGHADQQTTMQIYTHLTDTRRLEAEKALRKAEKTLYHMQNDMQIISNDADVLKNKGFLNQ